MDHPARLDAHLIVGGASHDFDFVRLELLKLFAEIEHVRTTVSADFEDLDSLSRAGFLVTYTCNVEPSREAEAVLAHFVEAGGRWLALHATNSLLEWTEGGVASRHGPRPFFETLGSAFVAHPPIGRYTVEPCASDHPLVRGIGSFEVEDELYLYDMLGETETLLETRFRGTAPGFTREDWTDGDDHRPVMYLRRVGQGEVLFLSLGHARGHYDAPHRTPYYPKVERGAWEEPVFYELLRRSIAWAARTDPALEQAPAGAV